MRTGKIRPVGKVLDHWQLLHESDFEDTDTKLLLHFNSEVTDWATGKTVTIVNATYDTSVWKFGSASMKFDGTGDYLSIPDNDDWYFGAGNFTIDMWVRWSSLTGEQYLISQMEADESDGWFIAKTSGNEITFAATSGSSTIGSYVSTDAALSADTWYHIAVIRNGTSLAIYKNGTALTLTVNTAIGSSSIPQIAESLYIGYEAANPNNEMIGWFDEVRIVKGTAKWTSNFTPPTTPYLGRTTSINITKDRNNVLMISGEGVDASTTVIDECGHAVTCNGGAQIDTAQYKFGQSSILFDGNGDYLSLADSADWYFGDQPFTIDFWINLNSSKGQGFICQYVDANNHWTCYTSAANTISFYNWVGGVFTIGFVTADVITAFGSWQHIAIVRVDNSNSASGWRVFVDGVSKTLTLAVGAWNGAMNDFAGNLEIGRFGASYLDGWIDDIRISKGIARWTSDFTPPLKTTALINGDTDEEYKLVGQVVGTANLYSKLRFNNDSAANYGRQYLRGIAGAISSGRITNQTGIFFCDWSYGDGQPALSDVLIYAKSGYVRTIMNLGDTGASGTTVNGIEIQGGSWNNSTAPMAAISINGTGTNALGTGTKYLLYRKVT